MRSCHAGMIAGEPARDVAIDPALDVREQLLR